jgi:hypothetical protein
MEAFPDLTTEAKCRELLDRYPDNILVTSKSGIPIRDEKGW